MPADFAARAPAAPAARPASRSAAERAGPALARPAARGPSVLQAYFTHYGRRLDADSDAVRAVRAQWIARGRDPDEFDRLADSDRKAGTLASVAFRLGTSVKAALEEQDGTSAPPAKRRKTAPDPSTEDESDDASASSSSSYSSSSSSSSDDESGWAGDLAYDSDELSALSSASEGETEEIAHGINKRGYKKQTVKRKTPGEALRRLSKNIRADRHTRGRAKHDPRKHVPIRTNFGGHPFLVSPTAHRKDGVVVPLKNGPDGHLARKGTGKKYDRLGRELDAHSKRLGLDIATMNRALRILLADPRATLPDLPPGIDASCLEELSELVAVFYVDIARSSKAHELIETQGLSDAHSFTQRFSGKNPHYKGAYAGTGSKNLQNHTQERKRKRESDDEADGYDGDGE